MVVLLQYRREWKRKASSMIIYAENPMESKRKRKTTKTNELARLQDIRTMYKNKLYFYMLATIRNSN